MYQYFIPFYRQNQCSTFCLPIHQLMDVQVVCTFWLLWMFMYTFMHEHSVSSHGVYIGMELLDHMIILCLTVWGTAKMFSIEIVPFYTKIILYIFAVVCEVFLSILNGHFPNFKGEKTKWNQTKQKLTQGNFNLDFQGQMLCSRKCRLTKWSNNFLYKHYIHFFSLLKNIFMT